jgi:uncharacterized protein YjiS (DUF1127 family)
MSSCEGRRRRARLRSAAVWRAMMLRWIRRRQDARRLAQLDAEALIRDHGAEAYREAASASVTGF